MDKDYKSSPLWTILVETVKSTPLYNEHKAYVRDRILAEKPDISPEELSARIGIPIGEALVLLDELRMRWDEVESELSKPLPPPKFRKVALGGTFNEVHYGHLILILTALRIGKRILIGVTTDEFVPKLRKQHPVRPLEERLKELKKTLEERGWSGRYEIHLISDPYGPAIEERDLEAIVTSPLTYRRALEINELRAKRGLRPLEVEVCPLVVAEDGKPISSTRIALGEIYPDGRLRLSR